MRRQSSVHFVHSEEEEDEDQLKRLSMCFSVDISQIALNRNKYFDNNCTPDRGSRNPGGGLFGAVEDAYNQSSMSIAVPNKFFAARQSRSFLSGCDKYLKRSGKSYMPYVHRDHNKHNSSRQSRKRYKPENVRKRNLMESYKCPSQLNANHYERSYNNYPSYTQYGVRPPHRKHYERERLQEALRESFPEYDYNTEYSRKKRRIKSRQGRHFEGNNNFYNAFYNCEFPTKSTNRSYKTNFHDYNVSRHHLNRARNSVLRQASGYAEDDYPRDYNQFEYDDPAGVYNTPRCDSEWKYYDNAPVTSPENCYYSEDDDYDYYDDDHQMYRAPPIQKKSVDFLNVDCEVPYNIFKKESTRVNQRYEYSDSQPRFQFLNVEIPYKQKKRTIPNYQYDPYPKRADSGNEVCPMTYKQTPAKTYIEPWPPCRKSPQNSNPIACPSHSLWSVPQKCNRRTLKQKISGFFKGPKYKSRIKCCPKCTPQTACESVPQNSNGCLDHTVSSKSCILVEGTRPRAPSCPPKPSICGSSIRKTRCTVYPTLYRDIYPKKSSYGIPRPKVNSSQWEYENDGHSKSSSEFSRNFSDASSQDPPSVQESASVEAPSFVPSNKDVVPSCYSYSNAQPKEEVAPRPDCYEQPSKPNPSTINVCLIIHTDQGNLPQSPTVTAKVVESKMNLNSTEPQPVPDCTPALSSGCSPKPISSSTNLLSSPSPSQTSCKRLNSGTNSRVTVLESSQPSRCPSPTNIENDYTSVRSNPPKGPSPKQSACCIKTINMPKPCLSPPKSATEQSRVGTKKASTISFKNIDCENESCTRSAESRTSLKCTPHNNKIAEKNAKPSTSVRTSSGKETLPHVSQSCQVKEKPPARTIPNNCNVDLISDPNPMCKNKESCGNQNEVCNCRASFVQDLKRELLEALRSEQRIKAQLQFQQPTQRISLFPCVPETQSCPPHLSHSNAYPQMEPWEKHWLPL